MNSFENILPIEQRIDLTKMNIETFGKHRSFEQFVPLNQYLKSILVIQKLEECLDSIRPSFSN